MSSHLDRARHALAEGDPAGVLAQVTQMFEELRWLDELPPFPAGVREADRLLEWVGRGLWEAVGDHGAAARPLSGDCVLATTISPTGGHTAVIRDLATALPEPPSAMWLTRPDPHGPSELKAGALERTGLMDVTRLFGGHDRYRCACRMVDALADLRPARIFLVQHPADCVAVVAASAAAAMGSRLCLLHHSDGKPTAGLYLTGLQIVDFTPRTCAFTRSMLGLSSAWLPLTCPDPGIANPSFMASGSLRTALSGSEWKVTAMESPDYPSLIAAVTAATGGTHVHIGPIPNRTKRRVDACLRRHGVATERVIWLSQAPTVVQALREYHVDLVINTYPTGGARTAVEAMAAGVPTMWRSPTEELDTVRTQMKYPIAPVWRQPEDLRILLSQIDHDWLRRQGAAARSWYEKVHHPRFWAEWFADSESVHARRLPPGFDAELFTGHILEHALENRQRGGKHAWLSVARRVLATHLIRRLFRSDRRGFRS